MMYCLLKPPTLKKILIIDDDEDILEAVSIILLNAGFDVDTHSSGLYVQQKVMDYQPHAILLDVNLPGKPGTQVYKELCKKFTIPIIFFSANADKREVLKECNAHAFISKPFDIKKLVNVISDCVNEL